MHSIARPVSVGFLLGLFTLIFGIIWAVFLALNHEGIHRYLDERAAVPAKGVAAVAGTTHSHGHEHGAIIAQALHHDDEEASSSSHHMHEDDPMDEAHERLTKGHIHAMGLGLVAIAVSLIMVFLNAPNRIKAVASACVGVGGLFYPISWIIMGLRTVTLGAEGAEKSVVPIVALSVVLILAGVFLALIYMVRGILKADFSRE